MKNTYNTSDDAGGLLLFNTKAGGATQKRIISKVLGFIAIIQLSALAKHECVIIRLRYISMS